MSRIDRRSFLALAAGAVTAPASALTAPAQAQWSNAIIVNALGGLEDPNPHAPGPLDPLGRTTSPTAGPTPANPVRTSEQPTFDDRVLRDALASGLTAVNLTLGYVAGDMEPFEFTIRDIARVDASIRAAPEQLLKVYTTADILRAKTERRIGIIYGFQNAAMVGQDATRVDIFANLGVRVIQLTYNPANQIGDGSLSALNRGLTPFGHQVIERLNTARVIVDLSHSGENTCLEATRVSRRPVSINHTGCRALNDLPRNKTDAELRLVASKGGFVGIYFMPFLNRSGHASAQDVLAHIEHAVDVCGEDHVGIGTDGSVTAIDDLGAYKAILAQEIAARRAAGISAAGERPDTFPFVVDLRGVTQFHDLADRLQGRGHGTARIEKILGLNFMRYAKDVWGA